jgi:hypothetical protein
MQIRSLLFSFTLGAAGFAPFGICEAALDSGLLSQARAAGGTNYSKDAEAFVEAMAFPLLQTQNRAKLPGPWKPYAEAGFGLTSVSDHRLFAYTTNKHSPASFQSTFGKMGIGLPFGLTAEAGVSYVVSEQKEGAYYGTIGGQILDLSTVLYTDFVPVASLNASVLRTYNGPGLTSYAGNLDLGVYHRHLFAQLNYVLQMQYAVLTEIPGVNKVLIQHGAVISMPLFKGVYFRSEIFFPTISGSVVAGYQF